MKLQGKVALVTGASRGIGRAIAVLFAKEGADVAVNYNTSEKDTEALVKELEETGRKAVAIKCDVSQESEVKEMVEKTIKEFGEIDILVNNAGIVYDVPIFQKTVDQWKKTIETNLIGMFLCVKYVAPYMSKRKYGRIVNISSTNGINTFDPTSVDYDASKAGVIMLTKALAQEMAPNVAVNSVAPGWVDTDMNKDLPKDFIESEKKKITLKRFAKPEEIAKVVLFLSSDDASFINGSIVVADGGYR